MCTSVTVLLILVFLIASSTAAPLPAKAEHKTVVVPDDYSTIAAAIGNATDGDTILVKKGIYEEQTLTINKTISLIGEDASDAIINLHPQLVPTGGFHLGGGGIEPDYGWDNPIKIEANHSRILGFTINSSEGSIRVSGFGNTVSYSNIITGMALENSGQNIIGNSVEGTILCNGENHTIADNNLFHLYVLASRMMITNNTISGYHGGIQMGAYGNTIFNNAIVNCGGALTFWMDAADNLIYGNNFVNSSVYQVKIDETSNPSMGRWDNGIIGNYWSDYSKKYPNASEIDNSGIGDTPYTIDGSNKDNFPLLMPYGTIPLPTPSPEPTPTPLLIGSLIVVAVVVGIGLLVYLKKRKR
jgi:nitrous oxidase accessory protein NosD